MVGGAPFGSTQAVHVHVVPGRSWLGPVVVLCALFPLVAFLAAAPGACHGVVVVALLVVLGGDRRQIAVVSLRTAECRIVNRQYRWYRCDRLGAAHSAVFLVVAGGILLLASSAVLVLPSLEANQRRW